MKMKYLISVLALLCALAVAGVVIYRQVTAGPPVVLVPPSHLTASTASGQLLPGGWTNVPAVTLSAHGTAARSLGLDVEVRRQGQSMTGSPTATSKSDPSATVHLADGRYHWQARLHSLRGVSPWVTYPGPLNIDTRSPQVTDLSSPSDPLAGKTYHTSDATFTWRSTDLGSGVAGYSYRLDADQNGQATSELRTADASVTLTGLETGHWYFHVRALDHAGNWGPTVTFPVTIDVTPPGLADVHFSLFHFDPQFEPLVTSFSVTRPARLVRVGVYRQSGGALVRLYTYHDLSKGAGENVSWDGKDSRGNPVAAGAYMLYIRAIDQYGHSSLSGWRDLVVEYKRIVVSLSQQRLVAYDGNKVVLTTLVTTGNAKLPTPAGTFHVLAKFHPFTFISPWPKKSPFYYPPSKVQFALLFKSGGYFLHDAPWRSVFGPGSNAQIGTPGQNYTGTHGCVNLPPAAEQWLYKWADVGTIVQVVR